MSTTGDENSDGPAEPGGKDRYLVPGLIRGLEVLRAFTPERPNLSLSEIAELLGTSRSAAFRTVYTLAHTGCLLHDQRTQTYALGPAVLRLGYGYLATREVVEVAYPELERLRDRTDWSAHMGVLDGTSVLYVLRLPAPHRLTGIVHVGSRLPARSTTMGRVLLADLAEDTLVALYRSEAQKTGVSSPETLATVLAQWRDDRTRAHVAHIGDFEAGIASIAAPVRDMTGQVVAAINLSAAATPENVADLRDRLAEEITRTAARISTLLGWHGETGKPRDR
ncbi:IclR family transcriptional regulator [Amorphus orientalis]|uniref:IclR family pca regulon transcriptional regulator n=1 Tax=Amorphus orientalis TaxID=649198 RepID=A0AAE3VNM1_9HYPH|nr:IclR family transcriptional regulator [Amorphus orientalis]MDQ0315362.1 IclR family pca regulon transcriptional regulator [Amorphus orientalis]